MPSHLYLYYIPDKQCHGYGWYASPPFTGDKKITISGLEFTVNYRTQHQIPWALQMKFGLTGPFIVLIHKSKKILKPAVIANVLKAKPTAYTEMQQCLKEDAKADEEEAFTYRYAGFDHDSQFFTKFPRPL